MKEMGILLSSYFRMSKHINVMESLIVCVMIKFTKKQKLNLTPLKYSCVAIPVNLQDLIFAENKMGMSSKETERNANQ